MNPPPTGDAAILVDPHPLFPHVTVRVAGEGDPPCGCGAASDFVVLEVDVAVRPPHVYDFLSRTCVEWDHMLVGVCVEHLPQTIEAMSRALREP